MVLLVVEVCREHRRPLLELSHTLGSVSGSWGTLGWSALLASCPHLCWLTPDLAFKWGGAGCLWAAILPPLGALSPASQFTVRAGLLRASRNYFREPSCCRDAFGSVSPSTLPLQVIYRSLGGGIRLHL